MHVARTNMHLFERLLEAKRQGAAIYVIDPLYNPIAKHADEFITVKPGMDGILAAGIMKEILRLGLEDREFIEHSTHGFKDLVDLLEGISLEKVSEMTEVSCETITHLAYVYSSKPTATYMG